LEGQSGVRALWEGGRRAMSRKIYPVGSVAEIRGRWLGSLRASWNGEEDEPMEKRVMTWMFD